ncbi:hypothetical protein K523DRAFT_326022 [Schizophyllum commune Tattone D]|nr:hypothetical protein K523DRAFT_326022 [Schizophyllum commune Tattone D]
MRSHMGRGRRESIEPRSRTTSLARIATVPDMGQKEILCRVEPSRLGIERCVETT